MNTIEKMELYSNKARRIAANLAAPTSTNNELERKRLGLELKGAVSKVKILAGLSALEHSPKRSNLAAERKAAEAALVAVDARGAAIMALARIAKIEEAGNNELSLATIHQRRNAKAEIVRTAATLVKARKLVKFDALTIETVEA
jgi:hypothetical protein